MDENRKNIIIKEIQHWKQTRLLPEHYCDFLLNLYTEGSQAVPAPVVGKKRIPALHSYISIFLVILLFFAVFFFYFTELSFTLQIGMILFLGFSSMFAGYYLISKKIFEVIPLLASAIVFLITTVQAASIMLPGNVFALYFVTAANCLVWFGMGMKWRLISFRLSGLAGIIILIFTIFL